MARTVTPADEKVCVALGNIMRMRKVNDRQLSEHIDLDRGSIQKRRTGTLISAGELEQFSEALAVPLYLFYEGERAIHQWFAENDSSDPFDLRSRKGAWVTAAEAA